MVDLVESVDCSVFVGGDWGLLEPTMEARATMGMGGGAAVVGAWGALVILISLILRCGSFFVGGDWGLLEPNMEAIAPMGLGGGAAVVGAWGALVILISLTLLWGSGATVSLFLFQPSHPQPPCFFSPATATCLDTADIFCSTKGGSSFPGIF